MAWIRMGVFISLTLVATTLPAGGASTPAPARARHCATGGLPASVPNAPAHSPTPARPSQAPNDSGLLLQAASQMDVWKSAPTRPLGHSGPQLIATIGQAAPAVWKPSPSAGRDLLSNAVRVQEHAREWLTCRYPNAPPALG